MLFLITNQSNCFTLFVLKLGGDTNLHPIALGRKNYLFAGSHQAAKRSAIIYSFMAQFKIANVNPNQWLQHVLVNLQTTKVTQLDQLLPMNFGK